MSYLELDKLIESRFAVLTTLAQSIIDLNIRSLTISGAPGISKTYTLENMLSEAVEFGDIKSLDHLKGKITPIQLYIKLYENREEGQVLLLDDIDVFSDITSLDILKAVIDTDLNRKVDWLSSSSILRKAGVPKSFNFSGSVVFITNMNFDEEIAKGNSLTEHLKALLSRTHYLDLKVHTNQEVIIRIKQVLRVSTLLADNNLTEEQGYEITDWLELNQDKIREISLRSVLKLGGYIKTDHNNWRLMARTMMFKSQ